MSRAAAKSGAHRRQLVDEAKELVGGGGEGGVPPRSVRRRSGPTDPERGQQPHPQVWRPRARVGRPRRPEGEADASGGIWPGVGDAPGPCHPRLRCRRGLLVDPCGGKRRKGARGPETRVAVPRARTATPGTGAGGPRTPLGALRLLRVPTPGSPHTVPARRGGAPPAVNGEEAGTEEAGRRAGHARPPPPHSSPPVVRRGGRGGKEDGWTDGRTAPAPPGPPRARARGQTLVSRADFQ